MDLGRVNFAQIISAFTSRSDSSDTYKFSFTHKNMINIPSAPSNGSFLKII